MSEMIDCKGCHKQIHYTAKSCPSCGAVNMLAPNGKSKIVAGLLAIFLGCWGIHKFYLGRPGMGVIYILCTFPGMFLFGIPTLIIWIVSLVEGIMYLCASDADFSRKYDPIISTDSQFKPQSEPTQSPELNSLPASNESSSTTKSMFEKE